MAMVEALRTKVRPNETHLWRAFLVAFVVAAALFLPSCIDEGEGFPDIVSMTVNPSSIPQSETGMVDETLTVTITVADFAGEIVEADAFVQLQSGDRPANKQDMIVEGNTIRLVGITNSLFSGLEPGDYQLGATVTSDAGESVQELDLATVSITP